MSIRQSMEYYNGEKPEEHQDNPKTGYVNANGSGVWTVKFAEMDGLVIFEGDIILGNASQIRIRERAGTIFISV